MVKNTSNTRSDDIKDPRWLFGLLILATVILALILSWIVDQSILEQNDKIEWWKIIISGASLSVSLFLGSIVAIHAYRYINHLSHNWKIRHDYAVDRLDRLYGPLWDETKCIIKALNAYYRSAYFDQGRGYSPGISSVQRDISHVQRYEQLENSHLQLFLTKSVLKHLQVFHESVFKYDTVRNEIKESMAMEFANKVISHELLSGFPDARRDNPPSYLWVEISHDGNLANIFNPQPDTELELRMKTRFVDYLVRNLQLSMEEGNVVYSDAMGHLRENKQLEELRSLRKNCIEKGKTLLEILEGIIEKPESALD